MTRSADIFDENAPIMERIYTLAEATAAILQFVGDMADEDSGNARASLRALAMEIIGEATPVSLGATIKWEEGCNCHPDYMEVEASGSTVKEMAESLADTAHFGTDDLSEVTWRVPLSEQEKTELMAAHDKRVAFNTEHRLLVKARDAAIKEREAAIGRHSYAVKELDGRRHELTDQAIEGYDRIIASLHRESVEFAEAEMKALAAVWEHEAKR